MSEQASYFRIGLFVLAAVFILVCGIVVLGAGSWFEERITMETYLDESVQGLDIGTPLKYRGVQIGQVSRILFVGLKYPFENDEDRLRYDKYILVEVEVSPAQLPNVPEAERMALLAKRVKAGLRVRLASGGLTSPPYLEADYLDPQRYPPLDIAWRPEHVYIPSAPSTMSSVVATVERLAGQLEKIDVAKLMADINRLVEDGDRAINDLQVAKLREQGVALLEEVRESNARLKAILGNPAIDKTITELSEALDHAVPTIVQLRKTVRRLDGIVGGNQSDIRAVLRNLRQITGDATQLSEEAKQNPSRLLFGNPPPRLKPGEQP